MSARDESAFPAANGAYQTGMTLRDYFATAALAPIIANFHGTLVVDNDGITSESRQRMGWQALLAYGLADAMLAERAK